MSKLVPPMIKTFVIGVVVLGVILFLPAGSFDFWQAWVYILVFNVSANGIGMLVALKDPVLFEKRKKVGPAHEQKLSQKIIMTLSFIGLFGVLILSALDHRWSLSSIPPLVSIFGDMMVIAGYVIDYFVFREKSFGSSTIEIQAKQTVITTGPYAVIRHPMYSGTLIMAVGTPIALGSWWGLAALATLIPVLVWRILDEEKLLKDELAGYSDYARLVRYRLIPYIW